VIPSPKLLGDPGPAGMLHGNLWETLGKNDAVALNKLPINPKKSGPTPQPTTQLDELEQ